MQWESMGFSSDPFTTDPINQTTLSLYSGRKQSIKVCENILAEPNVLIVVEGARGVGTTSFANYLRFSAQEKMLYFTPSNEIRVGANWTLETLLGSIISNVVREIELSLPTQFTREEVFQNAKALTMRIAEIYRSFGVDALGFGMSYGKSAGINSQPAILPAATLGHHLEDLVKLIKAAGYKHGLLLQLNNLDLGEIQDEKHLKYLFNELRDYIQTDHISWFLVGDVGLRRFIAQKVDRLDDIVSYEVSIEPLNREEYQELINKRFAFYKQHEKAQLPIDNDVFLYLFDLTEGRLRYVFGLLKRLLNELLAGELVDKLTLDIAKEAVVKLARDRLAKHGVGPAERDILIAVVRHRAINATELANKLSKSRQYISKKLVYLAESNLLEVEQQGRNRLYKPALDTSIAYSAQDFSEEARHAELKVRSKPPLLLM